MIGDELRQWLGYDDRDRSWVALGACRGAHADQWFPGQGDVNYRAKAVCADCPVIEECRDYGMVEQFGVWGGLSEKERAVLRPAWLRERERRRAA